MIKIMGLYKSKQYPEWIMIEKQYSDRTYKTRIIAVDDDLYDEEIADLTVEEIAEHFNINECYVALYHKEYGLWGAWDGANRNTFILINPKLKDYARKRGFDI